MGWKERTVTPLSPTSIAPTGTAAMGSPEVAELSGSVSTPGSVEHGTGTCNPCAWYWKAGGCASGVQCDYCHLCPEGEQKRRKKIKIAELKSGAREPAHPRPKEDRTVGRRH